MIAIMLRLPESLLAAIDHISEETYQSRSSFIRQSIVRNLDLVRNVEMPLIREHYRQSHEHLKRIMSQ